MANNICPSCGLSNIPERLTCKRCGTSIHGGPMPFATSAKPLETSFPDHFGDPQFAHRSAEAVFQDYLTTAKSIAKRTREEVGKRPQPLGMALMITILVCGAFMFGSAIIFINPVIMGISAIIGFIVTIIYMFHANHVMNALRAEIVDTVDREKPGFKEFYLEWKRGKDAESRKLATGVLLGLVGATAIAINETRDKRERRQVEQAEKDLQKITEEIEKLKKKL